MPSIDKKGSVKTTTSGLKIDSLLVASSNLKLTRATKVEVCFYLEFYSMWYFFHIIIGAKSLDKRLTSHPGWEGSIQVNMVLNFLI